MDAKSELILMIVSLKKTKPGLVQGISQKDYINGDSGTVNSVANCTFVMTKLYALIGNNILLCLAFIFYISIVNIQCVPQKGFGIFGTAVCVQRDI